MTTYRMLEMLNLGHILEFISKEGEEDFFKKTYDLDKVIRRFTELRIEFLQDYVKEKGVTTE